MTCGGCANACKRILSKQAGMCCACASSDVTQNSSFRTHLCLLVCEGVSEVTANVETKAVVVTGTNLDAQVCYCAAGALESAMV